MTALRRAEAAPLLPEVAQQFSATLAEHGCTLERDRPTIMQINVGKRCNQACRHCHVDAGPDRTESMSEESLDAVVRVVQRDNLRTVDITGGAPELHPRFEWLVAALRAEDRHVIVRTNLTVLEQPGYTHLPAFYAEHGVELIASLPCYQEENVEAQRGRGVFDASIRVLRRLNGVGYGRPGSGLVLGLVFNPQGPKLPAPQAALEADYRRELGERYGITFSHLLTITNMPIGRFAADLRRHGELAAYEALLLDNFNPATVPALMCRRTINVGWDGALYDCDFNAMLGLPMRSADGTPLCIRDLAADARPGLAIATGDHCLGCTAGAGSSCSGALA